MTNECLLQHRTRKFNRRGTRCRSGTRIGGDIMELLVLYCEAQAAQRRLRDAFKDSSKPNEEPRLKTTDRSLPGTAIKRPK
jgi:hypothetical protein